jgi:DNA repair protein RadC
MSQYLTIKQIPKTDRPRERLWHAGVHSLSIQELLAIILERGTAGLSVMQQAQQILAGFGSLAALAESTPDQLMKYKGLGLAKACQLLACFELANRLRLEQSQQVAEKLKQEILSPAYAAAVARAKIRDNHKEHCVILTFDIRNHLISADELSVGTLNANLVHPREVFSLAMSRHAASIIVAHNHPSGDLEPSEDDIDVTDRLSTAGRIMGIELLDHIIISPTSHLSMREYNLL